MCVAITMEPGTELSLEEVLRMGRSNGDGIGMAWAEDGVVQWTKAVNYMPHQAHAFINSYKDFFRLVHFRLSTAGGVMASLCHPFEVGPLASGAANGHGSKVLIHNGHWHRWSDVFDILKKEEALPDRGPWSDSRLAAFLAYHNPEWLETVGGRIALMDGEGNITRYGTWEDLRAGIKVSNKSWDHSFNYTRRGRDRDWPGWGWTEEQWQQAQAHEKAKKEEAERAEKEKKEKDSHGKEKQSTSTGGAETWSPHGHSYIDQTTGQVHMGEGSGSARHLLPAESGVVGEHGGRGGSGDGQRTRGRISGYEATNKGAIREGENQSGKNKGGYKAPGKGDIQFDHLPWQNPETGVWYWIPPSSVNGRSCRIERLSEERARELLEPFTPAAHVPVED